MVNQMIETKVGFIGFGLIGGSIARKLKELNPKNYLIAYNHKKDTVSSGLQEAVNDGVLDLITNNLTSSFCNCNLIFLCGPVLANITYLTMLKDVTGPNCIITDVGSVKTNIHEAVKSLELEDQFIGGHPMTGSEKTGYQNSSSSLLENAYYILTPTKKTSINNLDYLSQLVKSLGSIPLTLDYREHDDITAAISHVPHIIASALVNMVKDNDDDFHKMRTLAAGGFKDITRIASSSATMWQNICLTNTTSIRQFLKKYIDTLQDIDNNLKESHENSIYRFFDTASTYRDTIPNTSNGFIKKVYEVYIDIIDETGAIATIATLLATNLISIKNIGIIHNREFEQGVLKIEFYDEEASLKASDILNKYRYVVYER
ncbi:MAG: prephenate dehydrogenase [Anaerocolumna sp.]